MNVDTDTQYAFTRPVADHMFTNYDGVLKVDGEVGNKKVYDPRAWGKAAEAGMAARVVDGLRGPALCRHLPHHLTALTSPPPAAPREQPCSPSRAAAVARRAATAVARATEWSTVATARSQDGSARRMAAC